VPEIIDPLKPEVLDKICSDEFIDCPDTCGGTQRVFGTKDCTVVDPCEGVTCPDTEVVDGVCNGTAFERITTTYNCVNGTCEGTPSTESIDCSTCPTLITPNNPTVIDSDCN